MIAPSMRSNFNLKAYKLASYADSTTLAITLARYNSEESVDCYCHFCVSLENCVSLEMFFLLSQGRFVGENFNLIATLKNLVVSKLKVQGYE